MNTLENILVLLISMISMISMISTVAQAQPAATLNKAPEWAEPVNLGTLINTGYNDVFPMLSPNGLSLYFSSNRPGGMGNPDATGFESLDIYVSHRESVHTPWGKPKHLDSPINTQYADHSTAFSPDGHWMYFASTRPSPRGCGKHDLYRSYRHDIGDDMGWEKPQNLGCLVNSTSDDSCPFLVVDDKTGKTLLYFVSKRKGGPGNWDIYVSPLNEKTGAFGHADVVGNINSPEFDGHFDAEHGIVWSGNKMGYGGGDLWVTQNNKEAQWTTPVNIGPSINTVDNEGCFTLSSDGSTLIFTSDRPVGAGGYDLYISKRKTEEQVQNYQTKK